MERRDFIKLLAGTGLGLAASQSPLKRLVQTYPLAPRFAEVEEAFKTAACGLCPAGCSINVRLVNNNAVSVFGNPLDPTSNGGLCAKGLSLLHQLYHPDRLKKPLKRSGPRGSGQWEVVEWDEAIEAIAGALGEIRAQAPEKMVFLNGRPFGFMGLLTKRWMQYFGSPHHIADHYASALSVATTHMMGKPFEVSYDLSNIDLMVGVGHCSLDYSRSPVAESRQHAAFRQGDPERRGRLIVFDDVRGITAGKADRYYSVEPGSYAAVLLALANVVVRFQWYDESFVREHTQGLSEWRAKVLDRYSPEAVEELTGVPATVFYEVASQLSLAPRKVVTAGIPALTGPGGLHTAMAMLALNALLGTIDRDMHFVEGVEHLVDLPRLPGRRAASRERLDRKGFPLAVDVPWVLPETIRSEGDAVAGLFLYHSNPLASHPGAGDWAETLEHVPLVVSFSPFMDESSEYADWVLPDSLSLEKYQEVVQPSVAGMSSLSVTQPMWDEPLYDTRPTGDVLLDLIKTMDSDAEPHFPWGDYAEFMEECLVQIYELKTGTAFLSTADLKSYVELARQGFWSSGADDEDEFLDKIYESGGWVQPMYIEGQWGRLFDNGSGRFELVCPSIRDVVEEFIDNSGKSLADLGLSDVADRYHMPEYLAPGVEAPVGKLGWLVTWNTGGSAELPWWWEVAGMHHYLHWSMWAELGTADPQAARRDLAHPPVVRFRLKGKTFELPAVLRLKGHQKTLLLPAGFGRRLDRSTPLPKGMNVLGAIDYRPDPLTGLPSYYFALESLELKET